MSTITKELTLKFVREKEAEKKVGNNPPKWSDTIFGGLVDGGKLSYKDGDKVLINYQAEDPDKDDTVEIKVTPKEPQDEGLLNYLTQNKLNDNYQIKIDLT